MDEIRIFKEKFSLVCNLMVVPILKGEVAPRPKKLLATAGECLASRELDQTSEQAKFPWNAMRTLADLTLSVATGFARNQCTGVICNHKSLA